MGYFKDAFDVGAGATLGSLAVTTGYNIGLNITDAAMKKAYVEYRSQYFDPIVRSDLCDIMVRGLLVEKEYPFPKDTSKAPRDNFFMRHKVFTISLICYPVAGFIHMMLPIDLFMEISILSAMVFMFSGIGIVCKKILRGGKKVVGKVVENTYKPQLDNDGAHYWYVREYIRQALASNELNKKDAILKISNTNLAQQFPDTLEEIEAHAFYYRQRLGM